MYAPVLRMSGLRARYFRNFKCFWNLSWSLHSYNARLQAKPFIFEYLGSEVELLPLRVLGILDGLPSFLGCWTQTWISILFLGLS
jgi:hypothetical protein